ncbi:ATP synthase F1, delta subunit [Corynebacterium glutamicum MB001]|uniref:ATP synthase subunit delta n=4 Tax=Corynebacterium TaxID=1716 RepID=ATPD_CORGL|nr:MULTISPECIES: F0F1 ATP synthase subunit delta [Corynebacterium]A4QDH0.1 RecName: Full=ATP synthase subunit delta; AltName: Full=ATP synthase F(1) sector subunit delta; AltName: Full=F-type ATPase subunit delta; Short=F-ATPase subunit delta [Corynebacterium glutamicum R]Q7DIC8.1 RecName: Full=ATP synthase subunit delta; AltName: Full=ATP synthase F(1) sector subunit delta; AltName: Full=F-type ATPase subunit delta; Short=F-ATPase subunit delta [Corynebacterium glutamicum ATCC 13032]AGN18951.1 
MHAASREALAKVSSDLDAALAADNTMAVAAQAGTELFDVVDILDGDRALRVAVADSSKDAHSRVGLIEAVFGGKVSPSVLEVLKDAAEQTWSTPREFRAGLVQLGRRALLRSAEKQGQLGQVEDELFRLSRILDRESKLTQLLSDRTQEIGGRRDLLAKVLYGKVTAVTEALALQAIGRPEHNPIDDIAALAGAVAELQGRSVAHVVTAVELNEGQQQALAEKLGRIYGRAMSIHSEVDTSLLGGMIIRVGDEVIDGSTSGKLERLRASFA